MSRRRVDSQDDDDGEATDMPPEGDTVTTPRWNRRELLKLSGVGVVSAGTAPLVASSDAAASEDGATTISIDNVRANAWEVTSIDGDAAEAPIGEENPPITLDVGARHRVENGGWSAHPLEIRDENDEPLLSQDADVDGRFEADAAVEWVDNGDEVAFTLTEELAAACDSYICTVHGSMRGQLETTDADDGPSSEIEDWNDLDAVRENLDGDYVLVADLDEETSGYDEHVANPDGGFEPIGSDTPFSGSFDGEDHAISGLEIDRPDTTDVGLFSAIEEAVIENVNLTNLNIRGENDVGSLVGQNEGEITNAHASGEVTAETVLEGDGFNFAIAGGLVGDNRSEITDSHAACDVSATGEFTNAGGLVGFNFASGSVRDSHAEGEVTASSGDAGGLVGQNQGEIEQSYAEGTVTGEGSFVGGLVGQHRRGTISESYATGAVTGEDESFSNAGGLVGGQGGIDNDGNASIVNSYATGDVDGVKRVGSFIGGNRSTDDGELDGVIERSYAVGTASADEEVGGFAGRNSGSVSESYWDTQSTGQETAIADGPDDGVEGVTTADMTGESAADNMPELDFDETWDVVIDPDDYPILQFQDEPDAEPGPTAIEDWDDLNDIRADRAGDYVLETDLDDATAGYDEHVGDPEDGFEPLGSGDAPFTGTFDGSDQTIADLDIDRPEQEAVGLFGNAVDATIEDITVIDATVTGDSDVGSIAGNADGETTIAGISVENTVAITGKGDEVGGVVGEISGDAELSDAESAATVEGQDDIGGIVGENNGVIENVSTTGHVAWIAESDDVGFGLTIGGIVGDNDDPTSELRDAHSDATIEVLETVVADDDNIAATGDVYAGVVAGANEGLVERCTSGEDGTVTVEDNPDTFDGDASTVAMIGGVVGDNFGEETVVRECRSNSHLIAADSDTVHVGGIVGENYQNARVEKSRAGGSIEVQAGEGIAVGGICGRNSDRRSPGATVDESLAAVEFTVDTDGEADIGGTVGESTAGTTANTLYWDTVVSDKETGIGSEAGDSTQISGFETEVLQGETAEEALAGFDFGDTWAIVTNPDSYPILQFEDEPDPTPAPDLPEEWTGRELSDEQFEAVTDADGELGRDEMRDAFQAYFEPPAQEIDGVAVSRDDMREIFGYYFETV